MKNLNVLITGVDLADKLNKFFDEHGFKAVEIANCVGYSQKFHFMEFIGATETKKKIVMFQTTQTQTQAIVKFILKYFNEKNNGILFSLKGEQSMTDENVLYVAIVNTGKGEKIVQCIRKKALVGATVIEGRGNGGSPEELFGVEIDSAKEIVLSVMPQKKLSAVKRAVKKDFDEENTDVVSFVLPVSDFNKLHQN